VIEVDSSRTRRRHRSRRELAFVAVRLFEEQGFAATTVEEIAATADYSASTFFRLFPCKEDAVFFDMPQRLDSLRSALGSESAWPDIRAALIEHAHTWEIEDPEFAAARVRLFHKEPALATKYLEYCEQYEAWLSELIASRAGGHARGDIASQLAASCIIACLRCAFRVQATTRGRKPTSVAASLEQAFDALEAGPLRGVV
jgi:AcrR family transcriptional regulator